MILNDLAFKKGRNFQSTIGHVLLGIVSSFTPFALIGWFYLIFFSNIGKAIVKLKRKNYEFFLILMMYLISFELLDRMAETSPFLPYELGKYFLVLFAIIGIFIVGIKNRTGVFLAVLVTPALFYDLSGQVVLADIINYYLAPLAIGLGIAFMDRLSISESNFDNLLRLIWLTSLSSLAFTIFKTPDFENINFTLHAQSETTGGQSSNQVSTILGFGFFLSVYAVIKKLKFSGFFYGDIIIASLFFFQGLLSFSRGGMFVAVFSIFMFFYFQMKRNRIQMLGYLFLGAIVMSAVFTITDDITGGILSQRYQGETEGTLAGSKEKDVDVITSGRVSIFTEDIDLWLENPLFGVGCGASVYLRFEDRIVAAHIELSRLLAEHGLFGLLYFIILVVHFFMIRKVNKLSNYNALVSSLYILALLTTFHAAMRTYVTPMLILLTSLKIVSQKQRNDKPNNAYPLAPRKDFQQEHTLQ
jgi:hypothetical protein